jgi:hypothetical protein
VVIILTPTRYQKKESSISLDLDFISTVINRSGVS